jgi:hypothetical protein
VTFTRASYHCRHCGHGHCPADRPAGLEPDHLSPALRPLAALAGTLAPFAGAAGDILRRFAGVRLSAAAAWAAAERAGADLLAAADAGAVVTPSPAGKGWGFALPDGRGSAGYVGLDAFSVPMQQPDGTKAEWRMMYLGVLYTPDKKQAEYVTGWDLGAVAARLRRSAAGRGYARAGRVVAVMDAGSGLEEAVHRHFDDGVLCVLDWYHAAEHLHGYARAAWPADEAKRAAWSDRAQGVLDDRGGVALAGWLRDQELPAAGEELRRLIGYFEGASHRTAYPAYRSAGLDIGSGPTEAGCKVVGARLKGSGMRWCESGAEQVGALRALYESGPALWDGFWESTRKRRAA